MRVWTLLCLTILCSVIDFDTIVPLHTTTQPATTQPDTVILWDLKPFYEDTTEKATPEEISSDLVPNQDEYIIRTRVIIEFVTFKSKDGTNVTMYGASPPDIKAEFKNAETIYAALGLKFQFTQIVFQEYQIGIDHFMTDAERYQDYLSVYYTLPHAFPFEGMSVFPWYTGQRGILLTWLRDKNALAHEIGHYFGLLHTFQGGRDGDYCDDTCEQENFVCDSEDPDKLPNCRNVMNYCSHSPQFVTADQIFRMRRFLRSKRINHVIFKPRSIDPEIEKMYNSILELIVSEENNNESTNPHKDNP